MDGYVDEERNVEGERVSERERAWSALAVCRRQDVSVVAESEFLRRLHEYEDRRDCSSSSSRDVRVTSSAVTSPHLGASPSRPSVVADSVTPESETR